jgi:anti-sigma B factor antagonist
VLDICGPLVEDGGPQRLKERVTSLVRLNQTRLVLNMGQVTRIDSAGLGQLVSCLPTTTQAGGNLKLANLTRRGQKLLSITRLVTVFDTFESEAAAVQSFLSGYTHEH